MNGMLPRLLCVVPLPNAVAQSAVQSFGAQLSQEQQMSAAEILIWMRAHPSVEAVLTSSRVKFDSQAIAALPLQVKVLAKCSVGTDRQPIHVGELVTFLAAVNYTGTSSMEIGIKVIAENIQSQVACHANSCFFTMVAVDDDRKPVRVAPIEPLSHEERRRHAAAIVRKQIRQEFSNRFDAVRSS